MKQRITDSATALLLCGAFVTSGFSKDGAMHGEVQPPLEKADFSVFSADDQLGLFLLVGQSNMKGRGSIDMEPKTDKRILFFHPTQERWFVARDPLHATGTPDNVDPRDNAGTRPGLSFAKAIARKGTDAGIGLNTAAAGGAPMNLYHEGNTEGKRKGHRNENCICDPRVLFVTVICRRRGHSC